MVLPRTSLADSVAESHWFDGEMSGRAFAVNRSESVGKKIVIWLAMGFGAGRCPVGSGTVGTLLGVLIVLAMARLGLGWQIGVAAILAVAAIPICDAAERQFGTKDDHRIVADEYLTFPLCVLGLPWMEHPWLLGMAFVVNRVMDVVKPPPARQIQVLRGGWGVALDDVISSLYALGVNHLVWWVVGRMG